MSFWGELKRREVFRVAIAYVVASWLIVQVVGVLTEPLSLPDSLDTVVVVLLAIGFPFALMIAWVYEVTPEGVKVTVADGDDRTPTRAPRQRLTYAVVVLLIMAIGLMAFDRYVSTPPSREFAAINRIAVLPCTDLSPDPTNSFFAAGTHAQLINQLSLLKGLAVTSQASVMQYANGRTPIREVADELNVSAVMQCLVQYSGDRVLLMAQLIDGESDTALWTDSYPADRNDLAAQFEMQAEIAMNVADALEVALLETERDLIERPPTQSREAYELYLAAKALPQVGTLDRRLQLIDEALRVDETFVDAWLERSEANSFLGEYERAWEDAQRALQLSPADGRAYVKLAFALMYQGRWLEAEQHYRRALELGLAPSSFPNYGFLHMVVGRFDEAHPAMEAYLEVNPMDYVTASFLMMTYELLGDYDARQRAFDRGERLYQIWPEHMDDALIRLAEGDDERLRGLATVVTSSRVVSVHALAVSNLDSPASAIEALREFHAELEVGSSAALGNTVQVVLLSAWAAFFGDSALALEWLEEALTGAPVNLARAWYPAFDSVRREPGFEQLLADLGLPEYWDTFGWPEFCQRINDDEFRCS